MFKFVARIKHDRLLVMLMIEKKRNQILEVNNKTIALFIIASFTILLLYIVLYKTGIVQAVQDITRGLIHQTLLLNVAELIGAVYGVLFLYGKMKAGDLGLKFEKLPIAVTVGAVIWIAIQVIEAVIGYSRHGSITIEPSWGTQGTELIGLLIGMFFGTALFEEIGFRGFLLFQFKTKLEKMANSVVLIGLSLILSQVFFALLHVPWKVMNQGWTTTVVLDIVFSAFMNGIIYGLLYLRTMNLFFVMIIHALGNAPTSLIEPSVAPPNILLLLAILFSLIWPWLEKARVSLMR